MIYFTLPSTNNLIYKFIDCVFSDDEPENVFDISQTCNKSIIEISNSLSFYLYEIKNKIKNYEKEWDMYKKYTNPYEFINTIVPGKSKCVAKYKPLSRSYFKMIELLQFFVYDEFDIFTNSRVENTTGNVISRQQHVSDLHDNYPGVDKYKKSIRTFHLAEGPGGFIEAIANARNNPNDVYIGITILETKTIHHKNSGKYNKTVPGWKKSEYFLKTHPNIHIETGADKTGNILSIENFLHCRTKYASSMDFITADGGFDFSADFNNQEMNVTQLLFAQVCYALCLQKYNGTFILKVFDCFMQHTVDILYILSAFYETVYITKPKTSRYANSEKYIVCKNFLLFDDSSIFSCLKMAFQKMVNSERNIYRFLKIPVPSYFVYKLEEYNTIFGQQQIESINQTISLIEQIRTEVYVCRENDIFTPSRNNVTLPPESPPEWGYLNWQRCNEEGIYNINSSELCSTELESLPSQGRNDKIFRNLKNGAEKYSFRTSSSENRRVFDNEVTQSSKINNLMRVNIRKCIQWCLHHNISYNIMDE